MSTRDSDTSGSGTSAGEPQDPQLAKVLRAFYDDGGRLVQMPAKHSRRLMALDLLAQSFEPGLRYTEQEVNALLHAATGGSVDVVSARRHLVDEGLLGRADGVYWRSGGSVPV